MPTKTTLKKVEIIQNNGDGPIRIEIDNVVSFNEVLPWQIPSEINDIGIKLLGELRTAGLEGDYTYAHKALMEFSKALIDEAKNV